LLFVLSHIFSGGTGTPRITLRSIDMKVKKNILEALCFVGPLPFKDRSYTKVAKRLDAKSSS